MNNLKEAELDLRFLLNRGYRKKVALQFVSNHYLLGKKERNYLSRLIFSDDKVKEREKKIVQIDELKGKCLIIDGYNVLITVESILRSFKKPGENNHNLVWSDDGFIRDVESIFGKYKIGPQTKPAIKLILKYLKKYNVAKVKFFFDQQVSFSGKLVHMIQKNMWKYEIEGAAVLSKKVDHDLKKEWNKSGAIIATSDSAIIDKVDKLVDIPKLILNKKYKEKILSFKKRGYEV